LARLHLLVCSYRRILCERKKKLFYDHKFRTPKTNPIIISQIFLFYSWYNLTISLHLFLLGKASLACVLVFCEEGNELLWSQVQNTERESNNDSVNPISISQIFLFYSCWYDPEFHIQLLKR
jgi:hypothetical protein